MSGTVTAETYVVLKPDIRNYSGDRFVHGIAIDRFRTNKPSLKPGEVAVKLRLVFERSTLLDSIPVITVPVSAFETGTQPSPVAAEAVLP